MAGSGELERIYQGMLVSRLLDERCQTEFAHWYPAIGEEATTIGAFSALRPGDFAVPHYRGSLGVFWLRGMTLQQIIAGILLRQGSPTEGRLSGLHGGDFADCRIVPYVTNVIGPNIPTGVGLAIAESLRNLNNAGIVAFGDGSAALGIVHESLNMAAIRKAPLVFVCQNNQYSISTRSANVQAWDSVASWASGYGIVASKVDGNDAVEVSTAVGDALDRSRAGHGPGLVEARTFRIGGHFSLDEATYQDGAEADHWRDRDPIALFENALMESGDWSQDRLDAQRKGIADEIDASWRSVAAGPAIE